jgi:Asp/Glu/hydantoin racemase
MKTPRVAAVYTAAGIVDPCVQMFEDLNPDVELVNIVDSMLIFDINRAGTITPAIERRTLNYFRAAGNSDADAVLCTCSSIGEIADRANVSLDIPMFKIDSPMIHRAAEIGGRIGVIATLRSTLDPTIRFLRRTAHEQGSKIEVVRGLAEGAFDAVAAGDTESHDRMIIDTVKGLADRVDLIILAQASMARVEEALEAVAGKPVLSSLHSGIEEVVQYLEEDA